MALHPFIYLASQSPRRAQLLEQIGVAHRPLLPDAQEDAEALEHALPGEAPDDYVQRVTRAKLDAACDRWRRRQAEGAWEPAPILCADTTVALGRRILGKPADAQEARRMLQALSGRSHRVLTAVALWDGVAVQQRLSISRVRFAVVSGDALNRYIAGGEAMGKAGAYGIQGSAAQWVSHIEGSYTGIMGLPLWETTQLLQAARVHPF